MPRIESIQNHDFWPKLNLNWNNHIVTTLQYNMAPMKTGIIQACTMVFELYAHLGRTLHLV